ncbi:transcriptional regulator [Planotetraspora thailandica]|uniref:Transcriptional regulator n=1 Tax=Planotetraspora thailandica TaxID=487172 RepID=A0A8J3V9D3_9ACTN|nr:helix-turn-helix transcriptional regulator [Planotetraspora thailandica]GII52440.1 transcriptional regulator [Planotetraspora thailandica]
MANGTVLGEYLRARRQATAVEDVGLPDIGRRRTPGLRREELAMLAGVSIDYYIRLEQGREQRPSPQVLASIADALRLDDDAAEYLFDLVHTPPRPPDGAERQRAHPTLLQLMSGWHNNPAFLIGRGLNVLATNRLADKLYEGQPGQDNCLNLIFSPESRHFYVDWEQAATYKVGELRAALGRAPGDPGLRQLVEDLSAQSDDFRTLWARHDVWNRRNEVKRFIHHDVGPVTVTWDVFTVNSAPCQQLVVMGAEPESTSERALAHLGRAVALRPV